MVTNRLFTLQKTNAGKNPSNWRACKCQILCSSYLPCQMQLQAQPELPLIFFVCFSSSASSSSPAAAHSCRLLEPVKRLLPGYTQRPEHIWFLMPFVWGIYIWKAQYVQVPVGCHARLRTTDFRTNCPVFCHWQLAFCTKQRNNVIL